MKAEGSRRSRSAGRRERERESLKGREEQTAGEKESEGHSLWDLFWVPCTPSLPQRVKIVSKDALEVL